MGVILVDTSVWVDHLNRPDSDLLRLIADERCLLHPYVLAEIALGNLAGWPQVVRKLQAFRTVEPLGAAELLDLIARFDLQGSGLGFVDAHLLGSTVSLPETRIWSRDRRLAARAEALGVKADLA